MLSIYQEKELKFRKKCSGIGRNGPSNCCLSRIFAVNKIVVVQSSGLIQLFMIPWTAACQAPCPSPSPGACSNSCPLHQWCHPTISSSVVPFSSCLQSFPASGSFPMGWLFMSSDQSIGASASASVLPMSIQGWFPLGLTGLITLLSIFLKIIIKE